MKLVIQIPCYNEEETLPITIKALPKEIEGFDTVETLIINDGSTDKSAEIASKLGVNHIISFNRNRGLARAFSAGIEKSLELGADVIVNTDADNQYCGQDIHKLVRPILEEKADFVVGSRQVEKIPYFSRVKKILHKFGNIMVRRLSKTQVDDTVSGFRAFSKEAALKINTMSEFSYTIENLIQLGHQKMSVVSVPVVTQRKLRESRLFRNIPNFIAQQFTTMLRVYATYKALKVFTLIGLIIFLPGLFGFIRFLYYYFISGGSGHIQSLIFSSVLLIIGFFVFMFGIIADLISSNRKLIEKALYKIKKLEMNRRKIED